jgi:diguanylate cyclase (GGDEF)-like protein
MFLTIFFYSLSLLLQLFAAGYAVNLFFRAQAYRLTCGFLALGLGLMVGRRVSPLLHALNHDHINLVDAVLSVPISLCLLLGMFQLRKVFIEMEYKNFVLDQSTKLDSLTGALSRPESFSRTLLEIERSFRNKKCIAFLMMDIDHFKNVNDQYGHPVGDIVLMNLVQYCLEELRAIDILGRVGGEEFLIVLPETNQDQAIEVSERLRQHIASKACANPQNVDIFITVSIGIAIFDPCLKNEEVPDAILRRLYAACDKAMYQAKQAGRDQVCF